MTDPSDALALYQQAFAAEQIPLQRGALDRDLWVAVDQPNGHVRFSYMRKVGYTLTVLVMFAQSDLVDGQPYFSVGYAVPEAHRGQGLATSALVASLAELDHGLRRAGIPAIQIEAVIGVDHHVSQRVARAVFPDPSSLRRCLSLVANLRRSGEIKSSQRLRTVIIKAFERSPPICIPRKPSQASSYNSDFPAPQAAFLPIVELPTEAFLVFSFVESVAGSWQSFIAGSDWRFGLNGWARDGELDVVY